jgi:hypothetical protein
VFVITGTSKYDVYPVELMLNVRFMLTVTPAGNGVGESVIDHCEVFVSAFPTTVGLPGVNVKLTL